METQCLLLKAAVLWCCHMLEGRRNYYDFWRGPGQYLIILQHTRVHQQLLNTILFTLVWHLCSHSRYQSLLLILSHQNFVHELPMHLVVNVIKAWVAQSLTNKMENSNADTCCCTMLHIRRVYLSVRHWLSMLQLLPAWLLTVADNLVAASDD